MRTVITMKKFITISLDENIVNKLKEIKEDIGVSVSMSINRILKKEFKLK